VEITPKLRKMAEDLGEAIPKPADVAMEELAEMTVASYDWMCRLIDTGWRILQAGAFGRPRELPEPRRCVHCNAVMVAGQQAILYKSDEWFCNYACYMDWLRGQLGV
jgi:hypothetical protein